MKKKRILFAIESLSVGGAEKSLVTLLSNLDFSILEVDLLIFKRGGIFENLVPREVNIINGEYPTLSLKDRVLYKAGKMVKYGKLHEAQLFWKIIKDKITPFGGDYDVAIAYNQQYVTYYVATSVNADRKYTWMNTLYGRAKYNPHFDWSYFKKFNSVVAVSPEALCELDSVFTKESYPLESMMLKDIIESEKIIKQSQQEPPVKFSPDFINIVTVCRLDPSKGLFLALGAAQILKERGYKFQWYIIGEGAERPGLEAEIRTKDLSSHVLLPGATDNPYPYMRACDIYVQTSFVEGLGMTVIEAVVLQKPIVCTNFSTASSIVTPDDIITEKTPRSIASGIMEYLENPHQKIRPNDGAQQIDADKRNSLNVFNSLL